MSNSTQHDNPSNGGKNKDEEDSVPLKHAEVTSDGSDKKDHSHSVSIEGDSQKQQTKGKLKGKFICKNYVNFFKHSIMPTYFVVVVSQPRSYLILNKKKLMGAIKVNDQVTSVFLSTLFLYFIYSAARLSSTLSILFLFMITTHVKYKTNN